MNRTYTFRKMITVLIGFALAIPACANNISVGTPTLTGQNTTSDYTHVQFDLSWDNSWRDNTTLNNWDAAWVFVKYEVTGGDWAHATLHTSGHSVTNENSVSSTITAASDGKGVFIFRSSESTGSNDWDGVKLRWNYGTDGLADNATVTVKVFAIEMVYIPQGSFYVGDTDGDQTNCFRAGDGTGPYQITSEGAITVGTSSGNFYYDADNGDSGDQSGPIPADFPKGYAAFYSMKNEISQGQYVDFLNTLTSTQDGNRSIQGASNYTTYRGTISGSQGSRSASAPNRACNFLSWMVGAAYADWAGLRPMTELEYEKLCRGTQSVVDDEYAWANTSIAGSAYSFSNDGQYNATVSANYASDPNGNVSFSATDGSTDGPLRCGIFATSSSTRAEAGAGYYGVMELSGNLYERLATVGNATGRAFDGTHGDGVLSTDGHANVANWPGISSGEVTTGTGAGFRGGAWTTNIVQMPMVDRTYGSLSSTDRGYAHGARAGRTAP